MSDAERSAVLRTALLLALLEGWTMPMNIRARLGVDVAPALGWLTRHGYAEASEHDGVRWRAERDFEALWDVLVPERPCPVRLCTRPGSPRVQELR